MLKVVFTGPKVENVEIQKVEVGLLRTSLKLFLYIVECKGIQQLMTSNARLSGVCVVIEY